MSQLKEILDKEKERNSIEQCTDIHQNEQIYKKLMFDKLEINKGVLLENVVAQMLRVAGNELYSYSKSILS